MTIHTSQNGARTPLAGLPLAAFDPTRKCRLEAALERLEDLRQLMIAKLDAMDGDVDLEAQGDDEPWLAFGANQGAGVSDFASTLDLEDEHTGAEPDVDAEPNNDDEPSLGSLDRRIDQSSWASLQDGDGWYATDGEDEESDELEDGQ